MTTAHRPTWKAAVGNSDVNARGNYKLYVPTMQKSARDAVSHQPLKTRKTGQNTAGEVQHRDLRAELEAKEAAELEAKQRPEDKLGVTNKVRGTLAPSGISSSVVAAAPKSTLDA